jgi:AraC-like DNA-binding protein
MSAYSFFTYNTNEALLMDEGQRQIVVTLLEALINELRGNDDEHQQHIIVSYIELVLEHVARFYAKQLSSQTAKTNDLLTRFENLLNRYYADGIYRTHGLPTVKYCAQELFLSPNYFGDLIHQITDDTASNAIRRFVMQRAQKLLIGGANIAQTAEQLGFDYPQHFTRVFKKFYGVSPSAYLKELSK